MSKRYMLLLSSSNVAGYNFLEYAKEDIINFFKKRNISRILFVPYANVDHNAYLKQVTATLSQWGFQVDGIHQQEDPVEAVKKAEAVFVGGGNTFLLLKSLYDNNLIKALHERVVQDGMPYMGSSAGTNVATCSVYTTNDMPIIYPPSFDALNLVPFNINPHYIDTDINSTHKGETREQRIKQYLEMAHAKPVLAMREGCHLVIEGDKAELQGLKGARLFIRNQEPKELEVGSFVTHINKLE